MSALWTFVALRDDYPAGTCWAWLLRLPARRERLAHVDAEIARLDPPPPTTDMAAYGGLGSTAARRYQRRYTDETIHRLAELHAERVTLVRQVAYAEQLLAEAVAP